MDIIAYMQTFKVLFSFQATSGYIDIEHRKNSRCHLTFLYARYDRQKKYEKNVGHIVKCYIFASPFEIEDDIADVAQLARARDL